MNGKAATLVFPAVNQVAFAYLTAAKHRGEETVCAASVACDEIAAEGGTLYRLPTIYDADFPRQLLSLVAEHGIGRILCPLATVHDFMGRFIAERNLELKLIGQSPIRQQVEQHQQLMARAKRLFPFVQLCADGAPCISALETAGVLRQASLIYGESNDDKLAAMMGVFSTAPAGDVVEIGSLMGRTAFVLLYLAKRHKIGAVLTIDPWMLGEATQHDAPVSIQSLSGDWDFEVLSEGFHVNMVPFSDERHAHLRLTSAAAYEVYCTDQAICCTTTGTPVNYAQKIAVIHIDGNHDYESVKKDCELWLCKMLPGSWLILDDYIWAHGDGPYRVGNEFLAEQSERVANAFVCGGALFIKFR